MTNRELAVAVVTRGLFDRPVPGAGGKLQRLTAGELEYLEWLGQRVLAEQRLTGHASE